MILALNPLFVCSHQQYLTQICSISSVASPFCSKLFSCSSGAAWQKINHCCFSEINIFFEEKEKFQESSGKDIKDYKRP